MSQENKLNKIRAIFALYEENGKSAYIGEQITQAEHALQCAHKAESSRPGDFELICAALFHDIANVLPTNVNIKQFVNQITCKTSKELSEKVDIKLVNATSSAPTSTLTSPSSSLTEKESISTENELKHIYNDDGMDLGVAEHEKLGAHFLKTAGFTEKVYKLAQQHVNTKRYLVSKNPLYLDKLSFASQQTLIKQGGPMTETERLDFENDPLFPLHLLLRQWDEQAKVPNAIVPPLEHYIAICSNCLH